MKRFFTLLFVLLTLHSFSQVYILNEDFSSASGTTPPVNWQNTTLVGQTYDLWHFDDPGSRVPGYPIITPFAIFDATNYSSLGGQEKVVLETPFMDISIGNYCLLFFDHKLIPGTNTSCKILAHDGTQWSEVITYTDSTNGVEAKVVDLTSFVAGITNAKLRFQWQSDSLGYWAIDNIRVYVPLLLDAGIAAIDSPAMPFNPGLHDMKVALTNFGYQTLTSATINWSVDGVLQTPFSWSGSIPYNTSQNNINIGSYNFQAATAAQVKVWTDNPNGSPDPYHLNDTTIKTLYPALCGTFTIGGTSPNFASFTSAVQYISMSGVSCSVVFQARDGTYTEQIEIGPIQGSSAVNTVTFESESGDSSLVILQSDVNMSIFSTIRLSNARNLIFNKLSIFRRIREASAIEISNQSDNIVIQNCKLFADNAGNASFASVIHIHGNSANIKIKNSNIFGGSTIYGATYKGIVLTNSRNIQIENNQIRHVYHQGILLSGSSNHNIMIKQNIIDSVIYVNDFSDITSAIYADGDSIDIINNTISNSERGIILYGNNPIRVIGNKIYTVKFHGIQIYSSQSFIANNYIQVSSIFNAIAGVYVSNASNSSIVYNSINIVNSNSTCRAYELTGGSNLLIKNNIFSNSGSGYVGYINGTLSSSIQLDYNNYFTNGNRIGIIGDSIYTSFNTWSNGVNGESHGQNTNPFYTSSTNLQPNQILLNNSGVPIAGIAYDIDSTLRNPTNPDIGAKEFSPCVLDAGINQVSAPTTPISPGFQDVKVILQNQGTTTLTSATINWKINGLSQPAYFWTGSLAIAQNEEVTIGQYSFQSATVYSIKAWTANPNSGIDCNQYNDTLQTIDLFTKLCGIYTIGGLNPNFTSFNSAVTFLNNAGITCPVVFKVRNGTYNERIDINNIPGSTSINTVTFESESGDSSLVILQSDVNMSIFSTIRLSNARNLIFNKLSIFRRIREASAIEISNQSDNIVIQNCKLFADNAGNASFASVIHIHGNSANIKIKNSNIFGGSTIYGATYKGIVLTNSRNIQIENNQIRNVIHQGILLSGVSNHNIIIKQNVIDTVYGINEYGEGIRAEGDSVDIINNTIANVESGIHLIGSNPIRVIGNRINAIKYHGIQIYSSQSFVANNYIQVSSIFNAIAGVYVSNASNSSIVYNSINIVNSNSTCRAYELTGGSNLLIKNNIFSNSGSGYVGYINGTLSSSIQLDYNNYFTNGNRIGIIGDSIYTSFNTWSNGVNGESHGQNTNPFYTSSTNLQPNQILLNNSGVLIAGVAYDIDSTLRNPTNPDIGAKEFSPCALDAGINLVSAPTTPLTPGLQDVKVILQNQGTDTLFSATINWQVNGVTQTPFSWTGVLTSVQSSEVTVGQATFLPAVAYQIKAWTTVPNNSTDCDHYNDTITSAKIYSKLCGTYTIGGTNPDFTNISEPVEFLNNAGITCPVVFNIRNGTYDELLYINQIIGASDTNTITFQSESGDSSQVIITNNTGNPGIWLYRSKHLIFSKISLSGGSYNFNIEKGSRYITITNCRLNANYSNITVFSNSQDVVLSNNNLYTGGPHALDIRDTREIIIDNNLINATGDGIITGYHVYDMTISGNDFSRSEQGIRIQNPFHDSIVIQDNQFNNHKTAIWVTGNSAGNLLMVKNNRIINITEKGILLTSWNNVKVVNNFIQSESESSFEGISLNTMSNLNLIYNSVNILGNNNGTKCLNLSDITGSVVKNNILSNHSGGHCAYWSTVPTNTTWDFNNYYSSTDKIGYKSGTTYTSFTSWASAIGGEVNGTNLNPYFANDSSFRVYQRGLNGAGIPVAGVLYDIEGEIRNDQAPDIGCDEFTVDFGITQVLSPTLACYHGGNDSLTIWLRQFGDVPFTNIQLAYTVNSSAITYDTILGTIYNDIIYTFDQPINISPTGTYNIKCWLVNNIDDNVNNDTINVTRYSYPSPEVAFTYQNTCQLFATQFYGSATIVLPYTIASYEWSFGDDDTAVIQNPLHTYQDAGLFTVNMKAYSNIGCYNDTTGIISISPTPVAHFSLVDTACAQSSVLFDDSSYVANDTIANWLWNFGDGNSTLVTTPASPDVIHSYASAGTYGVTLSVYTADSCYNARLDSIVITPVPVADFSYSTNRCDGTPVTFTDQSSLNSGSSIISSTWNFGDTASGSSNTASGLVVSHTFSTSGAFLVTHIVVNANGCADTIVKSVDIFTPPTAMFSADTACLGSPTHFADASVPVSGDTIQSWLWDFGDGVGSSTLQDPYYSYAGSGTYIVSLLIASTHGCSNSISDTILVKSIPVGSVDPLTQEIVAPDTTLEVALSSSMVPATYSWSAVASSPLVTGFTASGTGDTIPPQIISTASNIVQTVTYSVTPFAQGCSGLPVEHVISVYPVPPSPVTVAANVPGSPGILVEVPIDVKGFDSITSISLRMDYDPTNAVYDSYIQLNPVFSSMIINEVTVSSTLRKILFAWSDLNPVTVPENTTLVKLRFTYITDTTHLVWNNTANNGQDCEYADAIGDPLIDIPTWYSYQNGMLYPGYLISGSFNYNNSALTPLDNMWVYLLESSLNIDSTQTDTLGNYTFGGLDNGTFAIQAECDKEWGGVNGTDAAKIERHFAGIQPITEPVNLQAADPNNSVYINATDALLVKRRFVQLISTFARGDWTFAKPLVGGDTVIVNGVNVIQNFYGLCVGDVNGSFVPDASMKSTSVWNVFENEYLLASPGQTIDLPIYADEYIAMTGLSLAINYPGEQIEVLAANLAAEGLIINLEGNQFRAAWSSAGPLYLSSSDRLMTLRILVSQSVQPGDVIRIAIQGESEIADEFAEPLISPSVRIPGIKIVPLAISDPEPPEFNLIVFPNPAKDQLIVEYSLMEDMNIEITLVNPLGQQVGTLFSAKQPSGKSHHRFDVGSYAKGLYTVRLSFKGRQSFETYRKIVFRD